MSISLKSPTTEVNNRGNKNAFTQLPAVSSAFFPRKILLSIPQHSTHDPSNPYISGVGREAGSWSRHTHRFLSLKIVGWCWRPPATRHLFMVSKIFSMANLGIKDVQFITLSVCHCQFITVSLSLLVRHSESSSLSLHHSVSSSFCQFATVSSSLIQCTQLKHATLVKRPCFYSLWEMQQILCRDVSSHS